MRAISRAFNRRIILPAYYGRSGDQRLQRLSELESSQWLKKSDLEALRAARLRDLIQHSYATSAYYRGALDDAGIKPSEIRDRHDLRHLPTLTKQIIQNRCDDMISSAFRRDELIEDASGGSTGVPTVFFKDLNRHRHRRADQIRHDQWSGWRLGEPFALLWGASRDLSLVHSMKEKFVSRFVDRAFLFDAFEVHDEELDSILSRLRRIKPTMILGYANALHLFAQQISDRAKSVPSGVRGIISSAESLTEEKRSFIEGVMGCRVLNRYGSREVGLIASECDRQEGLHINAENVIVEVLEDGKPVEPGQRGEIVVTDLLNYGMPFIRYRMGDSGILAEKPCSCGRGLPLMAAVEGRVSDFFTASDGTKIHGEFYTHLFYGIPQIRQFQLIQESMQEVVVKLATDGSDIDSAIAPVINAIKDSIGGGTKVTVVVCDEIQPTASGKFLFTISKVSS